MRRALLALLLAGCTAVAAPPSASPSPTIPPATASPTPMPTLTPRPFVCEPDFCYPRVYLTSALIAWPDANVDSGQSIVQLTQFSRLGIVIAGHAFTKMAAVIQWSAGDEVLVRGERFVVFGATETVCGQPFAPPPARLYMLTSITNDPCSSGRHVNLVVMAR